MSKRKILAAAALALAMAGAMAGVAHAFIPWQCNPRINPACVWVTTSAPGIGYWSCPGCPDGSAM